MIDEDTQIIPGHGDLAKKSDYQLLLTMVIDTAAAVQVMKVDGKTLDEVIEIGLGDKYKFWSWGASTRKNGYLHYIKDSR